MPVAPRPVLAQTFTDMTALSGTTPSAAGNGNGNGGGAAWATRIDHTPEF